MAHGNQPNYGTSPSTELAPYEPEVLEGLQVDAAEILRRYPQKRSALLPLLHLVQSIDGYISTRGIEFCAESVGLTPAEVSGVATFYTQYKRFPNGEYTVGVCTNTLCAIMGGDAIFERVSEHLGVGHDETTSDGKITLEKVECNAACDYAPVVMANWEFFDNQTPESAVELVDTLRSGGDAVPTRGAAKVCSFKEVSRVLAGFPDGRADEGPSAGRASLEGLRLAAERSWYAPGYGGGAPDEDVQRSEASAPNVTPSTGNTSGDPKTGEEQSSADTPANSPGETPGDEKAGE